MALIKCKECGNKVSSTAKACPKCGAEVTVEMLPDAPKRTGAAKMAIAVLIGFAGLIVLLSLISNINSQREEETAAAERARLATLSPKEKAAEQKKRAAEVANAAKEKQLWNARYACRQFVEKTLKDPETAQFQDFETYYAEEQKGGVYLVQVKVRAKNSFNATLNNVVNCRVRKEKNGDMVAVSIKQSN